MLHLDIAISEDNLLIKLKWIHLRMAFEKQALLWWTLLVDFTDRTTPM